ncbi:DUF1826 domain-containing protein [Reyranella sp.]|uniref:DUF1826 domain-containing protein n=1 Tax=Reyranella sp. TaxID=1929291 RepID=UPI003BABFFE8
MIQLERSQSVPRVVEGAEQRALGRITAEDVTLAIWHRPSTKALARWLDALPVDRLPEGRFVGPAACVPARVSTLCDLVEIEDGPERRDFVAEVARFARAFASVTRHPDVDLRLEAVEHDSCWRFHRDNVGYRLNATFRGPGTQWLPSDYAERALRSQRRYRGPLNELPRFSAGLFKGVKRAGGKAIVHRSPPVARSGQTRLFLCLNEVDDDG